MLQLTSSLVLVCLHSALTADAFADIKHGRYTKDGSFVDVLCSRASLDFGSPRTLTKCATLCTTGATCTSFFYNKQENLCRGSEEFISTSVGCDPKDGTLYYRTTESTTTTLTTTTTTTTTTTVPTVQFESVCSTNAECTMLYTTCLQGKCSCQAGYRHDPGSASCVINCATYGSTYIEYRDMDLNVGHTAEYTGITLSQCQSYCSSSPTCRGVNYGPLFAGGMCRLKTETPYTNPTDFQSFTDVHYYSRNCA